MAIRTVPFVPSPSQTVMFPLIYRCGILGIRIRPNPVADGPTEPGIYSCAVRSIMYGRESRLERMKERLGLRWTVSVEDFESRGWTMRLAEPIEVTVRSSGLGWEACSAEPSICCRGRTPSDALGFYRFCLSEYEA